MADQLPLPVPSEAIDFTPRELWPLIRKEHPSGTVMPATVPKKIWEDHWKLKNPKMGKQAAIPPPPAFVKSYWGKLRGRALSDRKRKAGADEEKDELPPVWPQSLSSEFWRSYFELYPDGHPAPESGEYVPWKPDEEPKKYALMRGCMHVNASNNREFPAWRASTGVDAWDSRGNWLGPG